jgi:MFS family permease
MSPRLFTPRFVLALGLQFFFGLGFSSFLLLPKYLAEVHHAGAESIGRMVAAGPIASVAVMFLLARYIDRVGRHWLLAFGSALIVLSSLGFAAAPELGAGMYTLRALQGVAFTVYLSAMTSVVADLAPPARLGQAIALQGAAMLSTNAIAPAIAEYAAMAFGWTSVFVGSAAFSGTAAAGSLFLHERREAPASRSATSGLLSSGYVRAVYACVVIGVCFGTVATFYQPLALSLGIHELSDLFVGYTLTAFGVRVGLSGWLDRFGRKPVAVMAASLYVLVVFLTGSLREGWLFPLGLGLGLAHGTLWPALSALAVESVHARARGAALTYLMGSFNVGMVASTLGFGSVASHFGYRTVFLLAAVIAASSVAVLAGLGGPGNLAPQRLGTTPGPR